jgi:hypothetical protein
VKATPACVPDVDVTILEQDDSSSRALCHRTTT